MDLDAVQLILEPPVPPAGGDVAGGTRCAARLGTCAERSRAGAQFAGQTGTVEALRLIHFTILDLPQGLGAGGGIRPAESRLADVGILHGGHVALPRVEVYQ